MCTIHIYNKYMYALQTLKLTHTHTYTHTYTHTHIYIYIYTQEEKRGWGRVESCIVLNLSLFYRQLSWKLCVIISLPLWWAEITVKPLFYDNSLTSRELVTLVDNEPFSPLTRKRLKHSCHHIQIYREIQILYIYMYIDR